MEKRQYETIYILHPHLDEEGINTAITKFEDSIKSMGGDIEKTERQGRKKTPFVIKKLNDGYYVLSHFNLAPNKIIDLRQFCKLSEPTLRSYIARKAG